MKYEKFIQDILNQRGRFNCCGYKERHHIVPKCLGGTNDEENLIDLYADEHYIAHKLLALENSDNIKLCHAWWRMSQVRSKNNQSIHISASDYAIAREMHAKAMSNRIIKEKTRDKIREKVRGVNNPMYGKFGAQNPCYGRRHTDEERQKMRDNHVDMSGRNNPMYGLTGDKSPHAKAVYCKELNKTFGSIKGAAEFVGVHKTCVGACLKGKQKTAGKHPITGERLHWEFKGTEK